ncbi:MAG: DCC1-like thiol-disulfide oxidoreductase family protein [Flavobacteriales bacterium]
MKANTTILLFDGECEFCNFWIQFVKKRNSKATFEFYSYY